MSLYVWNGIYCQEGLCGCWQKTALIWADNGCSVIVRQKEHVQSETASCCDGDRGIHTARISREPLLVTVYTASLCLPEIQFVIVSFIHHVSDFIHFIHVRLLLGHTRISWLLFFNWFSSSVRKVQLDLNVAFNLFCYSKALILIVKLLMSHIIHVFFNLYFSPSSTVKEAWLEQKLE